MQQLIIDYMAQFVVLNQEEEKAIQATFQPTVIRRKQCLLVEGQICDFIAFVCSGIVRHYHIKDGNEITCDITLPNSFITDFKSFSQNIPSNYYFQALKESSLLLINKKDLLTLYDTHRAIETFGRLMAENIAQRTVDIAMSLASNKPEERVVKLLQQQAELFQLVPQRYLANMLGISPESLSRIRARTVNRRENLNNNQRF